MSYKTMDLIHHRRHRLRREALQRESVAYLFQLPDEKMGGYLYAWVDGLGVAGSALFLYGPAIGATPIEVLVTKEPVADNMGLDDFRVGGLRVCVNKDNPNIADLTFKSDVASVDYHFEAMHPAYAYSCHKDGSPKFIADDRYEQAGRIRGVIRRPGHADVRFDTTGHRDHSWGTRHWGIAQHWKWCITQAGPGLSVHFMELHALGDRLVRGYVFRDGKVAEIAELDVKFEYDQDFWHTSVVAVVKDELGRTTTMKGTVFARYKMEPHPMSSNHQGSMRLTIEGVPGVGHLEMQWQKPYLDYIQQQSYMKERATGGRSASAPA
jgi:hypothetical protein